VIYETLARVVFARAVVLAIRLHLTGHSIFHSPLPCLFREGTETASFEGWYIQIRKSPDVSEILRCLKFYWMLVTKHSGGVLEDSTLLLPLGVAVFVVRGVCVINSFLDFLLCLVLFVQEMLPTVVIVVSWMEFPGWKLSSTTRHDYFRR
jgi:uncharacterized membrane protein YqaE (UPF0057 family)